MRKTTKHDFHFISERDYVISLYAIACRLSVCLSSVTLVHPTQLVVIFGIFSPYDSSGTLVFWCQKSLVGDAPFHLKFALKVTYPPF